MSVTVLSVTFPPQNAARGLPWDAFGNPPDILLTVRHGPNQLFSGFGGQDSFEATFDRSLGRLVVDVGQPLRFIFADRDVSEHDAAGELRVTELRPGEMVLRASTGVVLRLRVQP